MKLKIKVAIVDDQSLFRDGMKSMLKDFDHVEFLCEAENGEELIDLLKQGIKPDVILLDVEMPVMNGLQTAQYLKRNFPDLKVILLTMHNDEAFIYDGMLKGARGFLLKDTDIDEIVGAMETVLRDGYYINEYVSADLIRKLLSGNVISPYYKKNGLSLREKEIVSLLCNEYTNKEIAEILSISRRTVESHRKNIMKVIGAETFAGLVIYGIKNKLDSKFGYTRNKNK